jgi:YbbR domain-containing protein
MPSTSSQSNKPLFILHILRKIFLEDWLTKLLALAITLTLWVGVTGLSTPTTRRIAEVSLSFSYSNKTEITSTPVQTISLVLEGDKRKINGILNSDLLVSVDLSDVPPGDRVIQLTPDNVQGLPLGVRVQEIQPSRVSVKLESVEEKEVPVTVDIQGSPIDGFEVYSETVAPARVRVRGPASYVRSLTSISTDKIDLAERQSDHSARQVPLNLTNPRASVSDPVVDVMFRIGEHRIEKTFSVPVDGSTKKAQLTLYGGKSLFEGINAADFTVTPLENSERPQVTLPPSLDGRVEVRKVKLN